MRRWIAAVLVLCMLGAGVLPCAAEREVRHETYAFAIASDAEKDYLLKKGGLNSLNIRFADAANEIIYRFPLTETDYIQSIEFCGALYQQLLLSVSTDGVVYTEVYRWQGEVTGNGSGGLEKESRRFDLLPYVDLDSASEIYVKIADSYPTGGWGGALHPDEDVVLDITHIIPTKAEKNAAEMKKNAHRVPLFGCNEPTQGTFTLDTAHVRGGSASLRQSMDHSAPSLTIRLSPSVGAEGMDTLCFAWYLSDAALLAHLSEGALTLTDTALGTLCFSMADVAASLHAPVDGWNDVSLPLDKATRTDEFHLADIASVAWEWENVTETAGAWMCIDTIVLTDDQAVAWDKAMVNVSPLLKVCERISELLSAPPSEQTFKESARLCAVLREGVHALNEQDYARACEVGVPAVLEESERVLADYEKALKAGQVTPTPDEPVDERESGYESITPPQKPQGEKAPTEQPPPQNVAPAPAEQQKAMLWPWICAVSVGLLGALIGVAVARKKKTKKS